MNSRVTLLVFEGVSSRHESTRKVFDNMSALGGWGSCVYAAKDMSYREANMMEATGGYLEFLHPGSTHVLVCTWDGFIINPRLWTDEWLEYDMVGSPWPKHWNTNGRVGNMGFNMQSRRFLEVAKKYGSLYAGQPGDVFLCQKMRTNFESEGARYAPVELAARFGWEYDIEEGLAGPDKSFGFHGWVNGKSREAFYAKLSGLTG